MALDDIRSEKEADLFLFLVHVAQSEFREHKTESKCKQYLYYMSLDLKFEIVHRWHQMQYRSTT